MISRHSLAVLLLVSVAACGGEEPPPDEAAADANAVIEIGKVGFATPESVLHDSVADVYLVSNINGGPADKNGNGFITQLTPEGRVRDLKWINGEVTGVAFDAPKGMAIRGDTLYVADVDCVRLFMRVTGAPAGKVCTAGATFLNGIAVDGNGTLYVTDSRLNPDFSASGTDAVWRFTPNSQSSKLL